MQSLELEDKLGRALIVDLCAGCQVLWLDAHESQQLTPGGTIELFRAIGATLSKAHGVLPASLSCPRCGGVLTLTHDLSRDTRFTYYSCPRGDGRLTTFVQFLREKNFIRTLDPAELARLKAYVTTIRCSGCGAAVDLERATACPYCGAPIMALDPDAVAKALRDLSAAEQHRLALKPDPDRIGDAILAATRAERSSSDEPRPRHPDAIDLVAFGLAALAELIA
jgi:predicted RNA-binding Zn-ribbon protein involved in translation (DUF1610 family)